MARDHQEAAGGVCIGQIVGAQGIQGAVRVKSFTEDPLAVAAYGPVADAAGRRFRLKVASQSKGVVICRIDGVADRNAAEALAGTRLYVARDALPEPEEEEFYHADLIGLRVELEDGTVLGRVRAIFDFGAGDVLELVGSDGASRFLPFTRANVPLVEVTAGRLVARPPQEVEARPEGGAEEGADG
jgi:16S rRNA processing protein RimM